MTEKVVVLSGASGGIGLAAASRFKQASCRVFGLSRHEGGGCEWVKCDVTDESSVNEAVNEVIARAGHIDVLVNNAGWGISGSVEFTELEQAQRQLDVNFFGALRLPRAVLPHMRADKGGCVLFVSSIAAVASIPFQSMYSASKAAINQLALALANELRPFNIRVAAIMPGDIKTGFTAARAKNTKGEDVYLRQASAVRSMEKDEQGGMPPKSVAELLYRVSLKKHPKPLYAVGLQYKAVAVLIKLLPVRFANWVIGYLYS